jgi:hypothetical protein
MPLYFFSTDGRAAAGEGSAWPDDAAALTEARGISYDLSRNQSKLVQVHTYRENGDAVVPDTTGLVIDVEGPPLGIRH